MGEAAVHQVVLADRTHAFHNILGLREGLLVLEAHSEVALVRTGDLAFERWGGVVAPVGGLFDPTARVWLVGDDLVTGWPERLALVDPLDLRVLREARIEGEALRLEVEGDVGVVYLWREEAGTISGVDLASGRFGELLWTEEVESSSYVSFKVTSGRVFVLVEMPAGIHLELRDLVTGALLRRVDFGPQESSARLATCDGVVIMSFGSELGYVNVEERGPDGTARWRTTAVERRAVVLLPGVVVAVEQHDGELRLVSRERRAGAVRWAQPLPWPVEANPSIWSAPALAPCDLALVAAQDTVYLICCTPEGVDVRSLDLATGAPRGRGSASCTLVQRRPPDPDAFVNDHGDRLRGAVAIEGGVIVLALTAEGHVTLVRVVAP